MPGPVSATASCTSPPRTRYWRLYFIRPADRVGEGAALEIAEAKALLERHVEVVARYCASIARRHGLSGDDADTFRSRVHVHLLEGEMAVVRRYRGRGAFAGYLRTVIARCWLDFQNARFGKWRVSAAARRLGPTAERLDRLLNRDQRTLDEAVALLAAAEDIDLDERGLRELAARIPRRAKRTFVKLDAVAPLASDDRPDARVEEAEREARRRRANGALEAAISELETEDQAVIRLHYWEGMSIADVARVLGLDQKPLYRRLERLRKALHPKLVEAGIGADDVRELSLP